MAGKRLPEPEFLKLCIERDMKMIGECLVEAGYLEKRAFKWSRLEGKLRRRTARGYARADRALNVSGTGGGAVRHANAEDLIDAWIKRAANRTGEANMCHRHRIRRSDEAIKLRSLADRMQSNVTRCATRRRYLLV